MSDHCDGRRFFNPGVAIDQGLGDVLRWLFDRSDRPAWPASRRNDVHPPPPERVGPGEAAVTFIGHASALLTLPEGRVLVDPVFSERASPLSFAGPRRIRPPGLALDALPPIDLILLTHNHYDHLDLASLRRLVRRSGAPPAILTGLGNAGFLARRGVPGAMDLDWWQGTEPLPGLRVSFTPAQHWSNRGSGDRNRTLWGGFVLQGRGASVYLAGDTGAGPWFPAIRARFGAPDVALLPIGAYAPRWFMRLQHMDPAEAVDAHRLVGARHSVGIHFGTFRLTDEGVDEPLERLAAARDRAGLDPDAFVTLAEGSTRLFGGRPTPLEPKPSTGH